MSELTQEWILKTLTSLGLKQTDAEVYVSLTKSGSQKAADIAETLETYKRQIHRSLRNLQAKGMVNASPERPAQFTAISFEKVLDELIKANVEEAKRTEKEKEKILSRWPLNNRGNL